ncbi:MAG TPA: hypothetical protein VGL15_15805 [Vicinamibacteria bacterium]
MMQGAAFDQPGVSLFGAFCDLLPVQVRLGQLPAGVAIAQLRRLLQPWHELAQPAVLRHRLEGQAEEIHRPHIAFQRRLAQGGDAGGHIPGHALAANAQGSHHHLGLARTELSRLSEQFERLRIGLARQAQLGQRDQGLR